MSENSTFFSQKSRIESPSLTAIKAAQNSLGPEDTLTNIVAFYLSANHELVASWCKFLLGDLFIEDPVKVALFPSFQRNRPDMLVDIGQRIRIMFEHKLDSPEGKNQVEKYLGICRNMERKTGIPHYLAYITPDQHNLVGNVYLNSRFITINGMHPTWGDFSSIVLRLIEKNPDLKDLYEVLKYLYLTSDKLPDNAIDIFEAVKGLSNENSRTEQIIDAYYSLIRKAGKSLLKRNWKFHTNWDNRPTFIPEEDIKEKYWGLRRIYFDLNRERIESKSKDSELFFSVFTEFIENHSIRKDSFELRPLVDKFAEILNARTFGTINHNVKISRISSRGSYIYTIECRFSFDEISKSGQFSTISRKVIDSIIEILDPDLV